MARVKPNAEQLIAALRKGVHHERHGLTTLAADRIEKAVAFLHGYIAAAEARHVESGAERQLQSILNGDAEA